VAQNGKTTAKAALNKIQRMAAISISGCMKTTPTAALEILLDLPPLDIVIEATARKGALRLAMVK
jgi:hypothetical protein